MRDEAEATTSQDGGEPAAGGRLGRYVVLGRLGAGATGEVLAAYDPELDRKVALRVLRSPSRRQGDERRAEQRRLAAMQALARLSDPHVVAVHDVGLHEGRVFVAMELVEGRPLAEWRRAGRRAWPQVLGVMLQAGRGLAAAHAHGLAHGSFAADDVTIGDDGRVRVMDLGLARAIDEDSGDDRRDDAAAADVVAFCSCLAEVLRGIRTPGWLRHAVERGLADDPARRWSSMPELLAALERGGTRARRQRGLVALAVIAGVGASAWGWQRHVEAMRVRACEAEGASITEAWSDDVGSRVRDALVGTGVPRAASTAELVRPWLDAHAGAWQAARTEACLRTRVHGTWSDDDHERAQWCLDERRMELEAVVSELLEGEVRSIDRAVPTAWGLRPVEPCLDAAALARLPTPPVDQREAVRALQAELWQAAMLQQAGALDRGVAVASAALARARARGWPPTIAAAARRLGLLLDAQGRHAEAEAMLEDAFFTAVRAGAHDVAADAAVGLVYIVGVTLERPAEGLEWDRHHELLLAQLPDPAGWRRTTALANVASIHRAMGASAKAEALLREVLEIRERELGPEHPVLALTLNNLANVQQSLGALETAKALLERALAIHERALGPEDPGLALALNNLGNIHQAMGSPRTGMPLLERALAIQERVLGAEHLNVAVTLNNLGNLAQTLGELDRARALHERALAIRRAALGPEHPLVATSLINLASALQASEQLEPARAQLEQALAIQERALGPEHPELAAALLGLAEVALARGDAAEAMALAERVLRLHRAGESSPPLARLARFVLARALWELGEDRERARTLAEGVRAELRQPADAETIVRVDRWLAGHAEARP